MRAALVLLAGCWTGGSAPPPEPAAPAAQVPSAFEITMERTACFGACPAYRVSIDGDGRVRWTGIEHVVAVGERRATVPRKRVAELERALQQVRFFERDERGNIEAPVECVRTGNTTSCSFSATTTICSDGTSAIVTVRKAHRTHKVRNDHCDPSDLDGLEGLIDDIARTSAWIGERVSD